MCALGFGLEKLVMCSDTCSQSLPEKKNKKTWVVFIVFECRLIKDYSLEL